MLLLLKLGGLEITITGIIILVTCITSYLAEEDYRLKERYLFSPYQIKKRQEYYRFVTGGFLHGGYMHLAFNMITLYSFGHIIEHFFQALFQHNEIGSIVFALFYLSSIAAAGFPAYLKNKDNMLYKALGASGAVSAIVFAAILLDPLGELRILPIPFGIPAFIFGGLYMFYSFYMARNSNDNIGHDAHLFGAVFGIVFIIAIYPQSLQNFIAQVQMWIQG